MNAKNLKKLRKQCREVAALAGAPDRAYVIPESNMKFVPDYSQVKQDGTLGVKPFAYTGTVRHSSMSLRSLYRRLKSRGISG